MAKTVHVKRPHQSTKDEALTKLRGLTAQLASRYGVKITETASGATVKGRGLTGTCVIDDSDVTIDLNLGLVLRPLSSRIEQGVIKKLGEHFA